MNTIVMRGNELEKTITHTFTFLTSSIENNAIKSARQVENLAIRHDIHCETPENIERYDRWQPSKSKWNIIVQGTFTEIGLFVENAKRFVEECK